MNEERLMQVLLAPHVSEKSTVMGEANDQQVFRVRTDATKQEVRSAVEKLFGVKVASVRLLNMQGKNKRFGAIYGRRNAWKKAYVTLAAGSKINIAGAE